jgi:hypothetical protein
LRSDGSARSAWTFLNLADSGKRMR